MADTSGSPEQVAFDLFRLIAYAEKKDLGLGTGGHNQTDKKWVLSTYVECLKAVKVHKLPD